MAGFPVTSMGVWIGLQDKKEKQKGTQIVYIHTPVEVTKY